MSKKVGLALGGLGGFNSIPAAFLQAAVDRKIRFDAISCTSGAVLSVSKMLQGQSLREYIKGLSEETHPVPENWISSAGRYNSSEMARMTNLLAYLQKESHSFFRKPNFFDFQKRYLEKSGDLMTAAMSGKLNLDGLLDTYFDLTAPAQKLIPTLTSEYWNNVFDSLQNAAVPILLNTYNLKSGEDIVHINKKGRSHKIGGTKVVDLIKANTFCQISDLEPSHVKAALWLYLYGFKDENNKDMETLDGAYHRQFLMKELAWCDQLIVVRPQEANWVGPLPDNELGVQDFMIETWFNSAFTAELSHIQAMNKHIQEDRLKKSVHFNETDIQIFSPDAQFSSFDYFIESIELFDETYNKACEFLDESMG